jgi:hypothetical protein
VTKSLQRLRKSEISCCKNKRTKKSFIFLCLNAQGGVFKNISCYYDYNHNSENRVFRHLCLNKPTR